ncbi:hypothetical protein LIL_40006 (plasmid) [Leptospira interrogans serovar Linhai str. 56609]|nr:hypothetical protein LIL_40006 [Leptospira interrogans serovar Linhai str. 56609]
MFSEMERMKVKLYKYQIFNLSELLQSFVILSPALVWVGGEVVGKLGRLFSTTKLYFLQVKSMNSVGTLSKKSPTTYPFQSFLERGLKRRKKNSSSNDRGFIVFERLFFKQQAIIL